ncbi:hypothetical protein BWI93_21050 [Siphonobacter sp. BAB-5385]|nr:hypothetical protein BWI93_21050 [Siphonobacter sp. BAB-5385]
MMIHLLGIRHHGVGSARRVQERLTEIQPDLILVEGPPELTEILHWTAHKDLQPPVAVLAYDAEEPQKAVFYPFVEYSPEWVAVQYAHQHAVSVRMTDTPLLHSLAKEEAAKIDSLQKRRLPNGKFRRCIPLLNWRATKRITIGGRNGLNRTPASGIRRRISRRYS